MALTIKDLPKQNGGWFKPADNMNAVAILVEVQGLERQRPTPNGPKDSALVDITIFDTAADLDAGKPSSITEGTRVEQSALARDLFALSVGDATIVTVDQVPTKQKPAWVWRTVSADVRSKVIAYGEAREAAMQAAIDSVPDFD